MSQKRQETYVIILAEPDDETLNRIKTLWPEHYQLTPGAVIVSSKPKKGQTVGWASDIYARLSNDDNSPISCFVAEVQDNHGYYRESLWSWLNKVGR